MTEFNIRAPNGDDINFIYSTWLKSYKQDSLIGKSCRTGLFFREYRYVIDKILADPTTMVLIACHKTEPAVIFGYLVCEPTALHYIFIKEVFRRLGIATELCKVASPASDPLLYHTHRTSMLDRINHKSTHNPFYLFKQGEKKNGSS